MKITDKDRIDWIQSRAHYEISIHPAPALRPKFDIRRKLDRHIRNEKKSPNQGRAEGTTEAGK